MVNRDSISSESVGVALSESRSEAMRKNPPFFKRKADAFIWALHLAQHVQIA